MNKYFIIIKRGKLSQFFKCSFENSSSCLPIFIDLRSLSKVERKPKHISSKSRKDLFDFRWVFLSNLSVKFHSLLKSFSCFVVPGLFEMQHSQIIQANKHCWLVLYFLKYSVCFSKIEQSFGIISFEKPIICKI